MGPVNASVNLRFGPVQAAAGEAGRRRRSWTGCCGAIGMEKSLATERRSKTRQKRPLTGRRQRPREGRARPSPGERLLAHVSSVGTQVKTDSNRYRRSVALRNLDVEECISRHGVSG